MLNIIKYIVLVSLAGLVCCSPSESKLVEVEDSPRIDSLLLNPDFVMGRFDPANHPRFVRIDAAYSTKSNIYLLDSAYTAFIRMYKAASAEGVTLQILSAARNFTYQKGIWERKWTGETTLSDGTKASDLVDPADRAKKILLYSSMPGTSRHHWGTDIDLNNFNNGYFEQGKGLREYNWLTEHASKYGFCQPYTSKQDGRTGYEEEKWHWTYLPVSTHLTAFCADHLSNEMIEGFMGSESAVPIKVKENYVLGISELCLGSF